MADNLSIDRRTSAQPVMDFRTLIVDNYAVGAEAPLDRTAKPIAVAHLLPYKTAPAVRRVVLEYFARAGVDLKPEHEVHNVVHAISMMTSTRGVMLSAYTKHYLPESVTARPVKGEAPTLDLIIAYHKANNSPILKLLLSSVGKLVGAPISRA
jgi:hypothetical protein